MNEKTRLYTGVSRAAWGCVFLYFSINIGPVDLLPQFAAYLLFVSSIQLLQQENRDFGLLKPLGILLGAWNLLSWGFECLGLSLRTHMAALPLIENVISIYFSFQLFTNLATLADKYQYTEDILARRIRKWRTVQTVLATVLVLPLDRWTGDSEWGYRIEILLTVVSAVTCIALMSALFVLRNRMLHNREDWEALKQEK